MSLLDSLNGPEDLRRLPARALPQLAAALKQFLIEGVNETGGHFGAGLGAVELAIALHYVFDTPTDELIWDVGHQAYPHKLLTGRKQQFHTLRQTNGLAPFPCRRESRFDSFGVGHSSTSISAALGMAIAKQLTGAPGRAIAVIGDGAMTAGMAFEALNHAGDVGADLLVVLNDNEMSISDNVGALSNYFAKIISGKFYTTVREGGKKILNPIPHMSALARKTEAHLKGMVVPGTLFEELGFNYVGPIDGHDLNTLIPTLKNLKALKGPQILHTITKKGKGYPPAEKDPIKYHAVGKGFYTKDQAPDTAPCATPAKQPTFSAVFGQWICDMAAADPTLVGITPAMREGSDLVAFSKAFPDRYYDVGIAEQHCVTLAAGLATQAIHPVVAIYSTFLQRAYDQVIHDIAIQNLPVLFAIDRAGLVPDGPTHCGSFDLSFMACLPNFVIMAPADGNECRQMLYTGFRHAGPVAVRYPRGTGPQVTIEQPLKQLPLGKGQRVRSGHDIALLCFGTCLEAALAAAEICDATVVNMRFIKPLDTALIQEIAATHRAIFTIEENAVIGGAGSLVNQCLLAQRYQGQVVNLGIPDRFIEHGSQADMLAQAGLDKTGILHAIRENLAQEACKKVPTPLE